MNVIGKTRLATANGPRVIICVTKLGPLSLRQGVADLLQTPFPTWLTAHNSYYERTRVWGCCGMADPLKRTSPYVIVRSNEYERNYGDSPETFEPLRPAFQGHSRLLEPTPIVRLHILTDLTSYQWSIVTSGTSGLSLTVSETNVDIGRKSQNFLTLILNAPADGVPVGIL